MRINLTIFFTFFFAFLISLRLIQFQILDHDKYKALAESQHLTTLLLPAKRGDIMSSDGYSLAATKPTYLMFVEPDKVVDKESFTNLVLPFLHPDLYLPDPIDRNFVEIKNQQNTLLGLMNSEINWLALKHNVSEIEMLELLKLDQDGLDFEDEPSRIYPEESLASHILGFVGGSEHGENVGYYGVEGYYDGELRGVPGRIVEERQANDKPILVGSFNKIPPKDGKNITLTIDLSIQHLIENKIKGGVEEYGSKSGTILIMEPKTGKILGLANYPTFDPSKIGQQEASQHGDAENEETQKEEEIQNLAVAATFEPGSVVKALTMSSAIDLGLVTPQTEFDDFGPRKYSGHYVRNWDKKHHGMQTMIEVLQKSNNNGAAWVGTNVGAQKLRDYLVKFGLGESTGIDLEGEDTGIIRNADEWQDIDLATASFGQGISATSLQLVSAFSAIANDGLLMKPYVVEKISDAKKELTIKPQKVRRVLSEETAEVMVEMLTSAVEGGESKFFNLNTHRIAGKTGTAQIPVGGKYDPKKTNATFIGFLPRSKSFVMLIKLEEPSSSIYAAETAVPLWMETVSELTTYLGIPPDK